MKVFFMLLCVIHSLLLEESVIYFLFSRIIRMCKGGTSTIKLPIYKRDKRGSILFFNLFKFFLQYSMIKCLGENFLFLCLNFESDA